LNTFESLEAQLYSVNARTFDDIALKVFHFQALNNPVYRHFIEGLGINPEKIHTAADIPYLPISFFKNKEVKTGDWQPEDIFASSGTTASRTSKHFIKDLSFYHQNAQRCFEHFFDPVTDFNFLALLPSYLERKDSSLVSMIDHFIRKSGSTESGFYLHDECRLLHDLAKLKTSKKKTILWGVSFALLELAEKFQPDLSHCTVFETGGMKGRRRELTRNELHETLSRGLNVSRIFSEYGMTELLSQAYSTGTGLFLCPPWMKIVGRDPTDPFEKGLQNETCGINVIDLANLHSIAFIETEDVGKVYADGTFEVIGRLDNSDVRGCNLMVN